MDSYSYFFLFFPFFSLCVSVCLYAHFLKEMGVYMCIGMRRPKFDVRNHSSCIFTHSPLRQGHLVNLETVDIANISILAG